MNRLPSSIHINPKNLILLSSVQSPAVTILISARATVTATFRWTGHPRRHLPSARGTCGLLHVRGPWQSRIAGLLLRGDSHEATIANAGSQPMYYTLLHLARLETTCGWSSRINMIKLINADETVPPQNLQRLACRLRHGFVAILTLKAFHGGAANISQTLVLRGGKSKTLSGNWKTKRDPKMHILTKTYKHIQTHTNTNNYYGSVAAIWNDLVQETSLTFHCSPSGTRVAEWGQVVEKPRKRLLGTPRNWRSTYYIFPHDIWFLNCFNSNILYSFYTVIYLTQLCVLSMPIHKELFGSIWRQIRPKVCEWPLLRHQSNIS